MAAWIEINGVRSSAFDGVIVEDITPFLMPKRKASRAAVSGRMGPVEQGEPTYEAETVDVRLLVKGASKAQVTLRAFALKKWLCGEKLRLWRDETRYALGRVESGADIDFLNAKTARIAFKWTACPPCWLRVRSKTTGWEPLLNATVPEQITENTESASGAFTAPARLPVMDDQGAYAPALYFAVTGTWDALTIGGMTITQAYTAVHTVYIDCDAQVAYDLDAGVRTSVPIAGDFPVNDAAGILVGGTNVSAIVRALLIERW